MSPRLAPGMLRKLQPKLRMIADGDTAVNVVRAERCAALTVTTKSILSDFRPMRGLAPAPVAIAEIKRPKTPRLKEITPDVLTNVFVYLRDDAAQDPELRDSQPRARSGRIMQVQAVGSSRVDLQACKLEYSIVSPK